MTRKPVFVPSIHRWPDGVAMVTIFRFEDDGVQFVGGKVVSEYETASKGAACSARREIKRLQAAA